MMKRIKSLPVLMVLILMSVQQVSSQVDIGNKFLLEPGGTSVASQYGNPGQLISRILPNVIILAGVILLFLLVGGGFMIVSAAGDPEQMQKGTKTVVGAIIGFVVIFASFWIIQIIELITGISILDSSAFTF